MADGIIVSWYPKQGIPSSPSSPTVGGKASVSLRSFVAGTASVTIVARSAVTTTEVTFIPPAVR